MGSFLICPETKNQSRKSIEICLLHCEKHTDCDSLRRFRKDHLEDLKAAMGQCKIPLSHLKEMEAVIDVEEDAPDATVETQERVNAEPIAVIVPNDHADDTDAGSLSLEVSIAPPARGRAQRLYNQILSLKAEIEVRWFELGKILEEMFESRLYRELGYETWKEFCGAALEPLIDLKGRAIDYLRVTRLKCDEVGIDSKVAGEIGWTKLSQMTPVLTKENKGHWIKVAKKKGMTIPVLNAKVRVALGRITEKEAEVLPEKMMFVLFKEQKENIERALDLAEHVTGSSSRGYLLEIMAIEFQSTYGTGTNNKTDVVRLLIPRIEDSMKLKIGNIVDCETGKVLREGA